MHHFKGYFFKISWWWPTWVGLSLKVIILAGWLMSTSSCIFYWNGLRNASETAVDQFLVVRFVVLHNTNFRDWKLFLSSFYIHVLARWFVYLVIKHYDGVWIIVPNRIVFHLTLARIDLTFHVWATRDIFRIKRKCISCPWYMKDNNWGLITFNLCHFVATNLVILKAVANI